MGAGEGGGGGCVRRGEMTFQADAFFKYYFLLHKPPPIHTQKDGGVGRWEGGRERQRQRETQTDTQRGRDRNRETEAEAETERNTDRETQTQTQTDRLTDRHLFYFYLEYTSLPLPPSPNLPAFFSTTLSTVFLSGNLKSRWRRARVPALQSQS